MQWCIAKNGGGYMQTGVAKGLKVPCLFMSTEVSVCCQKTPEVGIRRIPAYTPPNTPLHVWYVDAGIKDTPEPVYTPCLVHKACCHRWSLRLDIRHCEAVCLKHDETDLQNGRSRIPLS